MTKIMKGWPPNSTDEDKKTENVITVYRGKIYLCGQEKVRKDLIVHEEIHLKQQGDNRDEWIARYMTDKDFRIEQEVEAYRGQLDYIEKTQSKGKTKKARVSFAKFLSGKTYNYMISFRDAYTKLL